MKPDTQKKTDRPEKKNHRIRRWVTSVLLVILVIGAAGYVAGRFFVIPGMIRHEFTTEVSRIWNGPIEVDEVVFTGWGNAYLRGIHLKDDSETEWITIDTLRLNIGRWQRLQPQIIGVRVLDLNAAVVMLEDSVRIPPTLYEFPERTEKQKAGTENIKDIVIQNASLTVRAENQPDLVYGNFSLEIHRNQNTYQIIAGQLDQEGQDRLSVNGELTQDNEKISGFVSLLMSRKITQRELQPVLVALGLTNAYELEGDFSADLRIEGDFRDLESLTADGTIDLAQTSVLLNDQTLVENFKAQAIVSGQTVSVDPYSGTVCGGPMEGTVKAVFNGEKIDNISGYIRAQRVQLAVFAKAFEQSGQLEQGIAEWAVTYNIPQGDLSNLDGEGAVFLNDADLRFLPAMNTMFNLIGLKSLDPLRASDGRAAFNLNGHQIVFKEAQVANELSALRCEPGGYYNWKENYIDMQVILIRLEGLHDFMDKIPLVNLFVRFDEKISRVQVKGSLSESPSKLVKKRPVEDIGEGTLGFVKGVVQTGGELTGGVIDFILPGKKKTPVQAD